MERALEQILKSTGMHAVILIGGPAPATPNDMSTHLYVSSIPPSLYVPADAHVLPVTRAENRETLI